MQSNYYGPTNPYKQIEDWRFSNRLQAACKLFYMSRDQLPSEAVRILERAVEAIEQEIERLRNLPEEALYPDHPYIVACGQNIVAADVTPIRICVHEL